MNERTLKRILNAEVLGLGLVLLAMQVLLYGVETAMRGTETRNLFWICLIAAAISFAGAQNNRNGKQISAMIVTLGLITVWILGARIAIPLVDLIRSLIANGPQIFPTISYRFDIPADQIATSWNLIAASSAGLTTRLQAWILAATDAARVNDILIRNMLWTFTLWLLSAWIGWFAAKRNGMASLLPGVVVLTLLVWSTERRPESLWAFVMIMLLLMGIWNYKNHVQHWETSHIDYSDSIRVDVSQFVLIIAVTVGLISYLTPSVSWREIRDYFRERQQPRQVEVITHASNNTNTAPSGKSAPKSSLPREHLLTGGSALSQDIVMTIKTGELQPLPIQNVPLIVPRYYWRSVIYDRYDGRGWFTTSAPPQSISANQPLIAGLLTGYKSLHLDVHMQQPEGNLYWSGILYSADIPLRAEWRLRPQSNLFADQTALLQADMFAARTDAASYTADSLIPIPSIQQLRAAAVDEYPQHIRDIYFALPDTVPERVHRLARQLTEGQPTVYDKAKAIETYLRVNYPYDLEISAPPDGQDVVDYFLFDLKRGYCDYYATAMVVLARSSGIPARFVSGYASGDYEMSNAQYVVRELHAHSWVEVYFPEIGWVEFEPTGNQPEIARHEMDGANNNETNLTTRTTFLLKSWAGSAQLLPWAILLIVLIAYFVFIEPQFLYRLSPESAIEILYRRFYRSGRPLAGESTRAETAYEFSNKLILNVQTLNADFRRSSHVLLTDVTDLTFLYQRTLFSDHHIERKDVERALMIWNRLRWSLIIEKIKHFFWRRNKTSR